MLFGSSPFASYADRAGSFVQPALFAASRRTPVVPQSSPAGTFPHGMNPPVDCSEHPPQRMLSVQKTYRFPCKDMLVCIVSGGCGFGSFKGQVTASNGLTHSAMRPPTRGLKTACQEGEVTLGISGQTACCNLLVCHRGPLSSRRNIAPEHPFASTLGYPFLLLNTRHHDGQISGRSGSADTRSSCSSCTVLSNVLYQLLACGLWSQLG
jgi:hypothetical protein